MDIKVFSTKDYFNYFFAGIIWLICATVLGGKDSDGYVLLLESVDKIPAAVLIVLLLVVPFTVGFVLSPVGNLVTKLLRGVLGDPADWVLVLEGQSFAKTKKPFRKRIAEPSRTKILKKVSVLQGGATNYSPFYLVRNYVEMKANDNALRLTNRALDLANFTESIIIPVSLLGFLMSKMVFNQTVSIFVGILLFLLLCYRYYQLREYWVKHNYRTFLFLE